MQLDMMKGGSLGFPHECHFKKQAKHVVQAAKGVSKEHGKRGRIAGEPLVALNCRDRQASWYINQCPKTEGYMLRQLSQAEASCMGGKGELWVGRPP